MTAAQDAARTRNWKIRTLRALHSQCFQLPGDLRDQAQAIIDEALVRVGADTAAQHARKVAAEFVSRRAAVLDEDAFEDIPF